MQRARRAVRRDLEEKGFIVYDVISGGSYSTLVAYDPAEPRFREILVCLDQVPMSGLGKLRRPRGITLEVWHRKEGQKAFAITKL